MPERLTCPAAKCPPCWYICQQVIKGCYDVTEAGGKNNRLCNGGQKGHAPLIPRSIKKVLTRNQECKQRDCKVLVW